MYRYKRFNNIQRISWVSWTFWEFCNAHICKLMNNQKFPPNIWNESPVLFSYCNRYHDYFYLITDISNFLSKKKEVSAEIKCNSWKVVSLFNIIRIYLYTCFIQIFNCFKRKRVQWKYFITHGKYQNLVKVFTLKYTYSAKYIEYLSNSCLWRCNESTKPYIESCLKVR